MSNEFITWEEVQKSMCGFCDELEDERLKDLHFLAGNEWLKGQGTPARTPFDQLLIRYRSLMQKYHWRDTPLQVKTLSQYERISH